MGEKNIDSIIVAAILNNICVTDSVTRFGEFSLVQVFLSSVNLMKKAYINIQNFCDIYVTEKYMLINLKKSGLGNIFGHFLQKHLVTLVPEDWQ
jgi:hypothetical protein